MNAIFLTLALTQPPLELHCNQTQESRRLLRALSADIPAVCEDTRAIQHFQQELRRTVVVKQSVDTFVQVGRWKQRLPATAYDCPAMTVLCLKREVDLHYAARRTFTTRDHDAEYLKRAGMVDLGSEGERIEYPQPWEDGFVLSSWKGGDPLTVEGKD